MFYQSTGAVLTASVDQKSSSPKVVFEVLDYYILISNYALRYQIIFCLPLGYLAMKYEAGRQKPSSHELGWCFRAEDSRNQF